MKVACDVHDSFLVWAHAVLTALGLLNLCLKANAAYNYSLLLKQIYQLLPNKGHMQFNQLSTGELDQKDM